MCCVNILFFRIRFNMELVYIRAFAPVMPFPNCKIQAVCSVEILIIVGEFVWNIYKFQIPIPTLPTPSSILRIFTELKNFLKFLMDEI